MLWKFIKRWFPLVVLPILVGIASRSISARAILDFAAANAFHVVALVLLVCLWTRIRLHQDDLSELREQVSFYEPTSRLKPSHINANKTWFHPYFLPREAVDAAVTAITSNSGAILLGKPMIGKTRCSYEALKREPLRGYHVLGLRSDSVNLDEIRIPRSFTLFKPKLIVFLDDLNQFTGTILPNELSTRLRQQSRELIILATCRDGKEWDRIENDQTFLSFIQQHNLTRVAVALTTCSEGQELARELEVSWNEAVFDGTPGSVLFDPVAMRNRLDQAGDDARNLMRTLHLMNRVGITEASRQFVEEAAQRIFKLPTHSLSIGDAWKRLHRDGFLEYEQGSIELKFDSYIDASFSHIYDALDSEAEQLRQFAVERVVARRKDRPRQPVSQLNRVLDGITDYPEAKTFLGRLRSSGIRPDVVSYTILLKKAPDLAEGRSILQLMADDSVTPNVVTYTTLLNKATEHAEAQAVFKQMTDAGLTPNVITYSTLIGKTDFASGRDLLREMVAKGLTPDVITYSTLIGKADFASGRDLLREMVAKGLTPNVITYSTLLKKVPNYAQAQNVLKEMKDAGLKPDLITYSTLLSKTTDFSQGRDVVKQMKDAGIEPDEIIYSKLFSKNPRYATAQEILDWFDAQRFHSLKPLNKLIESFHRARRFQDVLKITRLYPHLEASHRLRTMTFRRDDGVKP